MAEKSERGAGSECSEVGTEKVEKQLRSPRAALNSGFGGTLTARPSQSPVKSNRDRENSEFSGRKTWIMRIPNDNAAQGSTCQGAEADLSAKRPQEVEFSTRRLHQSSGKDSWPENTASINVTPNSKKEASLQPFPSAFSPSSSSAHIETTRLRESLDGQPLDSSTNSLTEEMKEKLHIGAGKDVFLENNSNNGNRELDAADVAAGDPSSHAVKAKAQTSKADGLVIAKPKSHSKKSSSETPSSFLFSSSSMLWNLGSGLESIQNQHISSSLGKDGQQGSSSSTSQQVTTTSNAVSKDSQEFTASSDDPTFQPVNPTVSFSEDDSDLTTCSSMLSDHHQHQTFKQPQPQKKGYEYLERCGDLLYNDKGLFTPASNLDQSIFPSMLLTPRTTTTSAASSPSVVYTGNLGSHASMLDAYAQSPPNTPPRQSLQSSLQTSSSSSSTNIIASPDTSFVTAFNGISLSIDHQTHCNDLYLKSNDHYNSSSSFIYNQHQQQQLRADRGMYQNSYLEYDEFSGQYHQTPVSSAMGAANEVGLQSHSMGMSSKGLNQLGNPACAVETPCRTVVIGNVAGNAVMESIIALCQAYGPVRHVYRISSTTLGVVYYDIRHATNALHNLKGKVINGEQVVVWFGNPHQEVHSRGGFNYRGKEATTGEIVVNTFRGSRDQLWRLCESLGDVRSVKDITSSLLSDGQSRKRGGGAAASRERVFLVEFHDSRVAEVAVLKLNGLLFDGAYVRCMPLTASMRDQLRRINSLHENHHNNAAYHKHDQYSYQQQSFSLQQQPNYSHVMASARASGQLTPTPDFEGAATVMASHAGFVVPNNSPASMSPQFVGSSTTRSGSPSPSRMDFSSAASASSSSSTISVTAATSMSTSQASIGFVPPNVPSPSPDPGACLFSPSSQEQYPLVASVSDKYPIDPAELGIGQGLAILNDELEAFYEALRKDEWRRPQLIDHLRKEILKRGLTADMFGLGNTFPSGNGVGAKKHVIPRSNEVNMYNLVMGLEKRTTFMIRNIPNKYTQQMLIDFIDETHKGYYDFIYLRIDFRNKCNVGYAFINFIDPTSVISFAHKVVGKRWCSFNSDKICMLSFANIQGKHALIEKFRNSSVMLEDESYRPKIFFSSGPLMGQPEIFPPPTIPLMRRPMIGLPGAHPLALAPPMHDEFGPLANHEDAELEKLFQSLMKERQRRGLSC